MSNVNIQINSDFTVVTKHITVLTFFSKILLIYILHPWRSLQSELWFRHFWPWTYGNLICLRHLCRSTAVAINKLFTLMRTQCVLGYHLDTKVQDDFVIFKYDILTRFYKTAFCIDKYLAKQRNIKITSIIYSVCHRNKFRH